jgi:integrase
VKCPGVDHHEARHLDADAVAAVLKAAETSLHHAALALAGTGDIYGHTSDDTGRAAIDHLSGAPGL